MSTVSSTQDPLVVVGVGERQREHALLLEVRLVDAGERPHDHRAPVHVARLHRRVLTRRTLAVVLVADRDPRRSRRPCTRLARSGSGIDRAVAHVDAGAGRVERERVVHADEEVAGDVGEVAAVPQPRTRGRDVVGRALADRLHQHLQAGEVAAVPRRERLEQLEPLGVRARPRPRPTTGRRPARWNPDSPGSKPLARAARRPRAARAAPRCRRRAANGSRTKSTSSRPVSAIAVTVSGEPMNDSVAALPSLRAGKLRLNDDTIVLRSPFCDVVALPLADARTARVGEHGRADRLEVGEQAVALDRGAHLLGARRDEQRRLHRAARRPWPGGRRARRARCPRTTSSCTSRRARSGCRPGSPPRAPPRRPRRSGGRGRACAGRRGAARARRGRCR